MKVGRDTERVARIFMKPTFWRHRRLVRIADILLRPLTLLGRGSRASSAGCALRILVFDAGAFGDMVLLAPFLRSLRSHFPTGRLTLLGRPGVGSLLVQQGLVDEWIPVRVPWAGRGPRWERNNLLSEKWPRFLLDVYRLRSRDFDIGFATGWSADIRGNLVLWLCGARRRVGYGYAGGEFLLTDVVAPDVARPHVLERNLQLLRGVGLSASTEDGRLRVTPEEENAALQVLERAGALEGDLLVGVHPGAGSAVREWGDDRFAEVARRVVDRFGARILWFTDPGRPRTVPAVPRLIPLSVPFRQLIAVLARCQLFICNDSGPMHVAVGLGVPVVAIFGPTQPEWFAPWGSRHQVVIRRDVWCRPCADQCIWEEPYCLRLISVDEVMEAVGKTLSAVRAKEAGTSCQKETGWPGAGWMKF